MRNKTKQKIEGDCDERDVSHQGHKGQGVDKGQEVDKGQGVEGWVRDRTGLPLVNQI